MNTSSFRSGLNRSLPVLPLFQTSEQINGLAMGQPQLGQSLQNMNRQSKNKTEQTITTTQLADALAYALPDGSMAQLKK